MSEVNNVQNNYLLTENQQLQLQKLLKDAKTRDEKKNIYNAFMAEIGKQKAAEAPQATVTEAQNAQAETNTIIKEVVNDEPVMLPDEYQERYFAVGNNEAEKEKIITEFLNDKSYFPDKTITTVTSKESIFGNRNSTKKEGGVELGIESTKLALIGDDGKIVKEAAEVRFETVKTDFQNKLDQQLQEVANSPELKAKLDKIDKDTNLTDAQKQASKNELTGRAQDLYLINEALNSSLKPEVNKLAESNKKNSVTTNKNTYYNLALTNDEKNAVNVRANEIRDRIKSLIEKPTEQLTAEEKAELETYRNDFNAKFPDEQLRENDKLWDLKLETNQQVKQETMDKMDSLAKMYSIEEHLAKEQGKDGRAVELNPEQLTKLAKAQMTEAVTHENEIIELTKKLQLAKDPKEKDKIEKQITKLNKNKNNMLKDIKKGMITDQAQAQVEFEAYKQNYDNTTVYWDKKQAKQAEEKDPKRNNTHLNDYARELIQKNPSAYCDEVDADKADFTDKDGKGWKLNSKLYQQEMLRISNSQGGFGNNGLDSDYFASTEEWSSFANEQAEKDGKDRPATMKERRHVREMIAAAGIQVSSDRTYKMRAGNITKDGLKGGGVGTLAVLGSELLDIASKINYSGTAIKIAEGIAKTTINGIASTTVSGTVQGQTTNTFESIIQKYDPNTGEYVTIGHQITETPINWSEDYSVDVNIPYQQDVTIPYKDEVSVNYNGSVRDKLDWDSLKNIGTGFLVGSATTAVSRALNYLFKKKNDSDYVNVDNSKETTRSNTGYEQKTQEKTETIETEKSPVAAMTKTEVLVEKEKTVEIPQHKYKLKSKEIIGEVICAKYGVQWNTPEFKAILKYVREVANGLQKGEIPKGDEYNLPEWIPGEVFGEGHKNIDLKLDATVKKTEYEKKDYNSRAAKNSGTYSQYYQEAETKLELELWGPDGKRKK